MVNLDDFDNMGPFLAHLDTFGPFQTKINLLPIRTNLGLAGVLLWKKIMYKITICLLPILSSVSELFNQHWLLFMISAGLPLSQFHSFHRISNILEEENHELNPAVRVFEPSAAPNSIFIKWKYIFYLTSQIACIHV